MARGMKTWMDKRTTTKRRLGFNGCGRDFAFGDWFRENQIHMKHGLDRHLGSGQGIACSGRVFPRSPCGHYGDSDRVTWAANGFLGD